MSWSLKIDPKSIIPVYKQIVQCVLDGIEDKKICVGMKMPSIHKIGDEFGLAPGTVIRAYDELRQMSILSSRQGKGYYISNIQINEKIRIFLLFDRMNAYKETLYESILQNLNPGIEVEVFFHHYDIKRFEKLIREKLGKYSFYAVMPHFNEDVSKILSRIPERKLIIMDKSVPSLRGKYAAVYQDFEADIYHGLTLGIKTIRKYKRFVFSCSESPFQFIPEGCITGFKRFCNEINIPFEIVSKLELPNVQGDTIYLLYSDMELISLIKEVESRNWIPGKEVGIISYDETPMKEILKGGISVLSTDFRQMGMKVASFINGEVFCHQANPFQFILRSSV
ncbi:MAG TPA: winged helix-turn-helix domain-containing protein [Prolixibacteraceae bacterium]|nr:winged helix-turn-helix domain-containing protein [Prolixibacteraceae bacterium]